MVDRMVLTKTLQRIVASKCVGVVDRSFSRFLSNDRHKFFLRHMFHHLRINPAIALQKAKDNAFASGSAASLSFSLTAEVTLVYFHFAVQLAVFKFSNVVDRFSEFLIYARDRLVIHAEVMRQTVRRLLLVEPLHNSDLHTDTFQGLLSSATLVSTPDVPVLRFRNLERTAEYALLSSQKVGLATENVFSSLHHMDILPPYGYETS